MKRLIINRYSMSPDFPMRGEFIYNDERIAFSGELPWKNNEQNISCIPLGEYDCYGFIDEDGEPRFNVLNVENRTAIQIHTGNYVKDIKGCIVAGLKRGAGKFLVKDSLNAMKKLYKIFGNEAFKLEIKMAEIKDTSEPRANWRGAISPKRVSDEIPEKVFAKNKWYHYIRYKRVLIGLGTAIIGLFVKSTELTIGGITFLIGGIGAKKIQESSPEYEGTVGWIFKLIDILFTYWHTHKKQIIKSFKKEK